MPRQRAIRFPDDLDAAIEAEAQRLGHPHTFSSVVINGMRRDLATAHELDLVRQACIEAGVPEVVEPSVMRGSPSPSLERFAKPETKR